MFVDWLTEHGIVHDPNENEIELTTFTPAQVHTKPQCGTRMPTIWGGFAEMLSSPARSDEKAGSGGFVLAALERNHRANDDAIRIWALVFDFDGGAPVDHVAQLLAGYRAVVHETFSSTPEDPRCRAFVQLREWIDVPTYRRAHELWREIFAGVGLTKGLDGAKDPVRLCYRPVRRPGSGYAFATTSGTVFDARRFVGMKPKPKPPTFTASTPRSGTKYVQAALRRAAEAIAAAADGSRHEAVCREAFCLARLDLSEDQIADALLPAAVHAMGKSREREARRTIRDAVRARKAGR